MNKRIGKNDIFFLMGIVVLATGKLDKKLNVKAKRFTAKAKEEIEALGGKAEVI